LGTSPGEQVAFNVILPNAEMESEEVNMDAEFKEAMPEDEPVLQADDDGGGG